MKENNYRKRWITQWWPNRLNLQILRQNSRNSNPYGTDYNYSKEVETLDIDSVISDLKSLMSKSRDWWPADFGHYGPLFIRLAWHSSGSYRVYDGRGGARNGAIRFPPRINWPDNINLDKALRLLWPLKKKYGKKLSWADLIILAGTIALQDMGVRTLGFSLGREDIYEPDESPDWGPEEKMLKAEGRYEDKKLREPYSATEMGLIYVNPAGPGGIPDPKLSAKEIRNVFAKMGMNDEETVALIAGGHSFGKSHGAGPEEYLGADPSNSPIEQQGLGWKFDYKNGKGPDTFTSGFELTWSPTPTSFAVHYLKLLFEYEWEIETSPAGKPQWVAKDSPKIIPDAHDPNKKHRPRMLTADLALRYDEEYAKISRRFLEHPEEFEKVFSRAWFKLTHRDMGPKACYKGPYVPEEEFVWQDPLPKIDYKLIDSADVEELKKKIANSGLSVQQLVYTAWSSASTYRDSDKRGGANGAKTRLLPMNHWKINHPEELKKIINIYENIQKEFNLKQEGSGKKVSIADLIVLGGYTAIEIAAKKAGFDVKINFVPGRTDAVQEQIEIDFYRHLEPFADGFRNYFKNPETIDKSDVYTTPEYYLVDKADQLRLTVQEMTALLGGMRALGAVYGYEKYGVLTDRPGILTNDFFVNLLDTDIEWKPSDKNHYTFEGFDRKTREKKWSATRTDLIFGHHDELRAVAEVYASDDSKEKFVNDFIKAWRKVMSLDRFDLK